MEDNNTFDLALKTAVSIPTININRDSFLRKELKKYCLPEQVEKAIADNTVNAGIDLALINKIADDVIKFETNKVTLISAGAGIPGGIAMVATLPADMAQYMGHLLRVLQKLAYLYGWDQLIDDDGLDDETKNRLTIFIGVMFGVETANAAIASIAKKAVPAVSKKLANKALTKTMYYPVVKKIAAAIGVKMTKDSFAKGVSKAIPVLGAITSGGLTYVTFRPMANKLKKHLAKLYYNN